MNIPIPKEKVISDGSAPDEFKSNFLKEQLDQEKSPNDSKFCNYPSEENETPEYSVDNQEDEDFVDPEYEEYGGND